MVENQHTIEDPSRKTEKHRLLNGSLAALSSPNLPRKTVTPIAHHKENEKKSKKKKKGHSGS